MRGRDVDLSKYIGRKYEEYNCLDLVKEFYKDFFGVEVKNYFEGPIPTPEDVSTLIISNKGDFVPVVGKPQFGDIAIIKFHGIECHLAVVIDGKKLLHSAKGIGSHLAGLERYSRMIAGYFRHKEAA